MASNLWSSNRIILAALNLIFILWSVTTGKLEVKCLRHRAMNQAADKRTVVETTHFFLFWVRGHMGVFEIVGKHIKHLRTPMAIMAKINQHCASTFFRTSNFALVESIGSVCWRLPGSKPFLHIAPLGTSVTWWVKWMATYGNYLCSALQDQTMFDLLHGFVCYSQVPQSWMVHHDGL